MSRKRAKKDKAKKESPETKATRPKGRSRAEVVLSIVRTDNTFEPHRVGENGWDVWWSGKCIHCNSKLFVDVDGSTDATLEHIQPICADDNANDAKNLALACKRCNNRKGIDHDQHAGKGGRADEVIAALREKREQRWRTGP